MIHNPAGASTDPSFGFPNGPADRVSLRIVAREWMRIGVTGFGGPPAHIALLRRLVVDREEWMDTRAFEDANAACSLLPGPASTQLAIFCAYRVAGFPGAVVGGLGFIVPAVALILALSMLFLAHAPPLWVRGAGAGTGAAVAAVAVRAGRDLLGPSYERASDGTARRMRWLVYLLAGGAAAALTGSYLVLTLLACGVLELVCRRRLAAGSGAGLGGFGALPVAVGHPEGSGRSPGPRSRSARCPSVVVS